MTEHGKAVILFLLPVSAKRDDALRALTQDSNYIHGLQALLRISELLLLLWLRSGGQSTSALAQRLEQPTLIQFGRQHGQLTIIILPVIIINLITVVVGSRLATLRQDFSLILEQEAVDLLQRLSLWHRVRLRRHRFLVILLEQTILLQIVLQLRKLLIVVMRCQLLRLSQS